MNPHYKGGVETPALPGPGLIQSLDSSFRWNDGMIVSPAATGWWNCPSGIPPYIDWNDDGWFWMELP